MFVVSKLCSNFLCKEHGGSAVVMVKRQYYEHAPHENDNQQLACTQSHPASRTVVALKEHALTVL